MLRFRATRHRRERYGVAKRDIAQPGAAIFHFFFTDHEPTRGSERERDSAAGAAMFMLSSRIMNRLAGWVRRFSEARGVESARVRSRGVRNLAGRVGSGQRVFDLSWVGSGYREPAWSTSSDPTRETPCYF